MRLYLNKTEAEELIAALQPHKDNPVLKGILDYLGYRKDLPPLDKKPT